MKTETARTSAPSDKAVAVAAVAQDKGKEKVGDVPAKAGEAEANGSKLPRPLDRMARLALLEEEGLVRSAPYPRQRVCDGVMSSH
jgi:hypothetical protein